MPYSKFGIEKSVNLVIVPRYNETDLLVRLENMHDNFDGEEEIPKVNLSQLFAYIWYQQNEYKDDPM